MPDPFPSDPEELARLATQYIDLLPLLTPSEQEMLVLSIVSASMRNMAESSILSLRTEILSQFEGQQDLPIVVASLEVIEGALALRQIVRMSGEAVSEAPKPEDWEKEGEDWKSAQ